MFSLLAKPFGLLLQLLYQLIGQYWLAIVILSLVVRGALYPVYRKQIKSTAGMAELSKRQQEIQRKYASDREKMNEEMQKMYKEVGYNPAGGCLPMFIQLIVISGLFVLLRNPMRYFTDDSMIFAVHESFLWIKDLAQPDPWILPILSGVATYLSSFFMNQNQPQAAGNQFMTGMMKYFFPIMIAWLAHSYPAALAIYWFIGQVVQIFFNLSFRKLREETAAGGNGGSAKKSGKKAPEKAKSPNAAAFEAGFNEVQKQKKKTGKK